MDADGERDLRRAELAADPIEQFRTWFAEATRVHEMPDAMTLATVDAAGAPDARMVLLKGVDRRGFRFFTNYESAKAAQLEGSGKAALVFHWIPLDRQVRVRGSVTRLEGDESDEYFASRSRSSRLGAWASPQSRPLSGREELERRLDEAAGRFEGSEVPRPPHWGGYLLAPEAIEFWQGRGARLHDRFAYRRNPEGSWEVERLAP